MAPRWERTAVAPLLRGPLFMNAELRPHRSLSPALCQAMLWIVLGVNAAAAAVFALNGAFPVAGFLGLDVAALWLAFHLSYRSARAAQYVRVGAGEVHVVSVGADGELQHWVLNPVWARVARDGPGVLVRDGAGQLRIGAFLSPKECDSFAQALDLALHKARGR